MAKKHYDEARVIRELSRLNVSFDYANHLIKIIKDSLGIRSLGKIDFLINYCGWHAIRIDMSEVMKERQLVAAERREAKRNAKRKSNSNDFIKVTMDLKLNKHNKSKHA